MKGFKSQQKFLQTLQVISTLLSILRNGSWVVIRIVIWLIG